MYQLSVVLAPIPNGRFRERKAAHEEKKERYEAALRADTKIRRVLGRDADLQALLDQHGGGLEREVGKHKHQREQEREQKEREARDAASKVEQCKSRILVKTEEVVRTRGAKERIENELKALDTLMLQDDYNFEGDMRRLEGEIEKAHGESQAGLVLSGLDPPTPSPHPQPSPSPSPSPSTLTLTLTLTPNPLPTPTLTSTPSPPKTRTAARRRRAACSPSTRRASPRPRARASA